jgi:uncharacterized coiled-coil protein SlyX
VTHRTIDDWDEEADEAEEAGSGRGWLAYIVIGALLVGTGSGSALLWHAAGGGPLQSMLPQSAASSASMAVKVGEVDALRQQVQQMTSLNQSAQQSLAAQQAEIKRLSEQVATLSGKLDLVQRPVTSAQAAIPPAKPAAKKKLETPKPVAAVRPEPKPESKPDSKQGVDPKPTGAISTGGAPLQLTR